MKTCSVPLCGDPHLARGLCSRHYGRWKKYGDPLFAIKPWKRPGETVIDCTGYLRVAGNKHVHREVAAQKLGRALLPGEVVHHLDGNKLNNDPTNIEVLPSHAEHARHHAKEQRAANLASLVKARAARASRRASARQDEENEEEGQL